MVLQAHVRLWTHFIRHDRGLVSKHVIHMSFHGAGLALSTEAVVLPPPSLFYSLYHR